MSVSRLFCISIVDIVGLDMVGGSSYIHVKIAG